MRPSEDLILLGDNLELLRASRTSLPASPTSIRRSTRAASNGARRCDGGRRNGDRTGFNGRRYAHPARGVVVPDAFDDYLGFLEPRLREVRRVLNETGTLYLHLDYREAHYVKLLLDELFGRDCFLNEIIWAYDYGAAVQRAGRPSTTRSSSTSRTASGTGSTPRRSSASPTWRRARHRREGRARQAADRRLVAHDRLADGKEKTGYPTQKPEGVLRRIVQASSRPGDWCLDCFAGSGTLGAVAAALGRRFVLMDSNPEAVAVARPRLEAGSTAGATGKHSPNSSRKIEEIRVGFGCLFTGNSPDDDDLHGA